MHACLITPQKYNEIHLRLEMYSPPHFIDNSIDTLRKIISESPLASIVVSSYDFIISNRIPLCLIDIGNNLYLQGHMAINNDISNFSKNSCLCLFDCEDFYVSPSFYGSQRQYGLVPTWNYISSQVYGDISIVLEVDEIRDIIKHQIAVHEKFLTRVEIETMINSLSNSEIYSHIVGIRIKINSFQSKIKMSQNRDLHEIKSLRKNLIANGTSKTILDWFDFVFNH